LWQGNSLPEVFALQQLKHEEAVGKPAHAAATPAQLVVLLLSAQHPYQHCNLNKSQR
jgi:hypothetical protein